MHLIVAPRGRRYETAARKPDGRQGLPLYCPAARVRADARGHARRPLGLPTQKVRRAPRLRACATLHTDVRWRPHARRYGIAQHTNRVSLKFGTKSQAADERR